LGAINGLDRPAQPSLLTMKAKKISIENAKTEKLFYFVANVVVFREKDKRCLILKRDKREKVHPGLYAVPGGKLEWKDLDLKHPTRMNGDVIDFEDAVSGLLQREVTEEAGIKIYSDLKYLNNMAFVRPDGIPVVMVKFAAKYKSGKVIPEKGGFTNFAWVNTKEVEKYKCIKGIKEEIRKTVELFSE
jgi:ADP-ribose pyrophosphatase YjhB (NUDIX family)